MVKVRISQIPEESGKPTIIKKKIQRNQTSKNDDWLDDDINTEDNTSRYNDEESDKEERYIKSMISFPQEGINMSLFGIETIEKDFRIKESNYGSENVNFQYGIVINKGMEPSMRYPKVNVDVWFDSEKVRDQRYDNMIAKLKQAGFKFIEV
jgi:hypothetical protein